MNHLQGQGMQIKVDTLNHPAVIKLLKEHMDDMTATSPPESVHALSQEALQEPGTILWTSWRDNKLLGCAAIKPISNSHAELKSMRTVAEARNQGVASALLLHIIEQLKSDGYQQLSLETGSMSFFKPARELYKKFGFKYCSPFAHYQPDPNSNFMTLELG
ncbi:N-acetyltransferase [Vibrio zhanjiangensis]|uniref:N-acetyltransferase n=2 Tax=Vibrio zhanjiangensis TaxID=1046128 RepID=A0ABQ6F131_9VIBR|nr:N-acetyltransferase [Vibrio zhanjiangensis]